MSRTWVRTHVTACLLAAGVGGLYGSGHLIHLKRFGFQRYEPMTVAANLEASGANYPRARAAYHGELIVGDLNLAEYQGSPAHLPMLTPLVLGGFGHLVGSMKTAAIVSDFLFPPVVFLLFYAFMWQLTDRRGVSLVAASVFIFAFDVPFWLWAQASKPPIVSFPFSRIDFPKITYLFYLPAAILTYLALRYSRPMVVGLAGVFAGLLFYTDLYDCVTFFTGLLGLAVFAAVRRDRRGARTVAAIIAVGAVVSIPYWVNLHALSQLPGYDDLVARVGVERSHGVRLYTWNYYLRVVLAAAAAFWMWGSRDPVRASYLAAFPLALLITLNLQVLTGFTPQPDHWIRPIVPFMYPTIVMVAILVGETWMRRIPQRAMVAAASVLVVCLFSIEAVYVVRTARRNAPNHAIPDDRVASYRWLETRVPRNAVIAALSPATNLDIQLFTGHKLFLPFGLNTVAPTEEIWHRLGYLSRLYGVSASRVRSWLTGSAELPLFDPRLDRQTWNVYLFQNAFFSTELNSYFKSGVPRVIPPALLEDKIARYVEAGSDVPPFRLDYVYYGPNEAVIGHDPGGGRPELRTVYEDDHVRIYRFH